MRKNAWIHVQMDIIGNLDHIEIIVVENVVDNVKRVKIIGAAVLAQINQKIFNLKDYIMVLTEIV